jgi:hypothetical protein
MLLPSLLTLLLPLPLPLLTAGAGGVAEGALPLQMVEEVMSRALRPEVDELVLASVGNGS